MFPAVGYHCIISISTKTAQSVSQFKKKITSIAYLNHKINSSILHVLHAAIFIKM